MAKKRGKPRRVRTPTVLQMEAVECGAAALSMILGYYGKFVPLTEVRVQCGVSRDGSKAANILKAARHYGCSAKGLSKPIGKLKEMGLPLIIFWRFSHFVVLEGWGDGEVFINDPAQGHRRVDMVEFKQAYTGVALTVVPEEGFTPGGRPPKVLPALVRTVRHNLSAVVYSLAASIFLLLPQLALPATTQIFIDSVLLEQRTGWFRPLLVFIAGMALLQLLLSGFQMLVTRRHMLAQSLRLNAGFLWHLLRLPITFYTQRFPGEVVNRAGLNDSIAQTVAGPLTNIGVDLISTVLFGAIMFFYDPVLTLVGMALASLSFVALAWITTMREEANLSTSQEMGRVHGTLASGILSIETLKSGAQEQSFFTKWGGYYAKAMNSSQRLQKSTISLGVLPEILDDIVELLILLIGGLRVMQGEMTIGMLVAFTALMRNFQHPVSNLLSFATQLQELTGNVVRVDDVIQTEPIPDPVTDFDPETQPVRLAGDLEVDAVTFGFNPNEPPLIREFSLRVEPGGSVALVGSSGSGKSTLAKVICGFYPPWSGAVRLDGMVFADVPQPVLRNSLGLVEQEIGIFEGTVRDNLTLWDSTVPQDEVEAACQDAEIHEVIQNIPRGYHATLLENGGNLSGGQRQRLELARALVNRPSLVVLDEATSALDSETERLIMLNLKRRGCTSLVIAHRLSTIRDCDEIIVLDRGDIVERGSHREMIQNDGPYSRLVKKMIEEGES